MGDLSIRLKRLEQRSAARIAARPEDPGPRVCCECGVEVGPLGRPLQPGEYDFPHCPDCEWQRTLAVIQVYEELDMGPTAALRCYADDQGLSEREALERLLREQRDGREFEPGDMLGVACFLGEHEIDISAEWSGAHESLSRCAP